ncbi:MAG: hypothetical protein QGD94_11475, partial [Planctomycetia bacterium]|nr:hypothetical protein [Planctomycetia bacterium]
MGCRALGVLLGICVLAAAVEGASLSVFIAGGRDVFIEGEELEVCVVLKTAAEFSGGDLRFVVQEEGKRGKAWKVKVPALKRGRHAFVYRIDSSPLKPATYIFYARLGELKSNQSKVDVVRRERPTNFGIIDVAWWPEGASAYPAIRYKPFKKANVNTVIRSGDSPEGGRGAGTWSDPVLAKQYQADLSMPAVEVLFERTETDKAFDGALRNGVSTLWRPFHITDRSWGGVPCEVNHGNQVMKRIMYHSNAYRRYPAWNGICFNDDPCAGGNWGLIDLVSMDRYRYLHPWNAHYIHPAKFEGVILDIPQKAANRRFRKWFNVPFTPRKAMLLVYQDDQSWVYVNGKHAASPTGVSTELRADLTAFVKRGRNLIAIELSNHMGPGFIG